MRPTLLPEMCIDEVMRLWPSTIRVLLKKRMLCVGCPVRTFHTVRECGKVHGLDEAAFMEELLAAIEVDPRPAGFRHGRP